MTFAISSSAKPGVDERIREDDQPGRVERHRDGTVEVRPETDVLDAGDIDRVADRPGDRGRVVATAGRRPEPDPEQPAGLGDAPGVRVGQVATVVGDAAEPGVRGDDRPGGHRQDVVDRRRRGMRDVDQHPARLHPLDHLAPGGGQAALLDAVRRPAEGVVEEMARRHHPKAGVGDDLDVRRVAVERVGALDREEAGGQARDRGGAPPRSRPGRRASG